MVIVVDCCHPFVSDGQILGHRVATADDTELNLSYGEFTVTSPIDCTNFLPQHSIDCTKKNLITARQLNGEPQLGNRSRDGRLPGKGLELGQGRVRRGRYLDLEGFALMM